MTGIWGSCRLPVMGSRASILLQKGDVWTPFGRTENLAILLVICGTNRTWGWKFLPLNHLFFFGVFQRTASHSIPAQDKERAGGMRGKFHKGRLPASQPTSKRLPFDSLFVLLTDRITLSYKHPWKVLPLNIPIPSADGILFSETCYTFFKVVPPRVLKGVLPWKQGRWGEGGLKINWMNIFVSSRWAWLGGV